MAVAASGLFVIACGQPAQPVANVSSPTPSIAPSASAEPSPTTEPSAAALPSPTSSPAASPTPFSCSIPHPLGDLCVGRAATAQEQQAMLAVGRPAVEAKYGLKPIASCRNGDNCFIVQSPLPAMVGTNAAVFPGTVGQYPLGNLGCFALVFLSYDSAGWHYVNSGCFQNPGFFPSNYDHVFVSGGCANVRTSPSLSATVLACLPAGTEVSVDSAPVYADAHIWWHLAGRGWMAHDFLLKPN